MTAETRRVWFAVSAWAGLILIAWLWGGYLNRTLPNDMFVQAPPLTAHLGWAPTASILWAAAFAVGGVASAPRLTSVMGWKPLLVVATLAGLMWTLVLVNADGTHHLLSSVTSRLDYLWGVRQVDSPGSYLASFTEQIGRYGAHVRSHPPGLVLILWVMDRIGLRGPEPAAALYVCGGAMAIPAVLLAVREVADEATARVVAPFLVLVPMAVWIGTSGDAFFTGVGAWACSLLILATGREGVRRDLLALAGGLLFACGLFLSYGLILLGLIPLAVIVRRKAWRAAVPAIAPMVLVFVGFAAAGFWWVDGLIATREQYLESVARFRPYLYFLVANLAALAIAVGPAAAAGLATLRERGLWLLAGGALAGVAVADLSGMSKGEVERIWLPFAVWLMVATAPLARDRRLRWWLGTQAALGLLLQVGVRSPW